jgi:hypothetical protein
MAERITRREALKLGTTAAVSAAVSPHLSASNSHDSSETVQPSAYTLANSSAPRASDSEICFMPARQMADLIRQKKLSSREVMQAHLKQINRASCRSRRGARKRELARTSSRDACGR